MDYCLYNAIKTPDGTVLWCQSGHDFKLYKDTVSGEEYMNDGMGYGIRRSINIVEFEDLSVWSYDPFEKIRTAKFWGSYGKDGKGEKKIMALQEMEDSHIRAILETQKQLKGSFLEEIFMKELEYRIQTFKEKLDDEMPKKKVTQKKSPKV